MIIRILILIINIFIIGCSLEPIEYDAEKEEAEHIEKIRNAQSKEDPFNNPLTPPYVKVGDNDEITVEVYKLKEFIGYKGLVLQQWDVFVTNKTEDYLCTIIGWKLQDFELETEREVTFLLKPKERIKLGKMKQTIWSFDEVAIAIPPSGYVENIETQEALIDEKTKQYTCDMPEQEIDDKDVVEQ
jgi:hypothetical protein